MKKRALISVSDKTGVVDFAKGLEKEGYEIISTGGTYKTLEEAFKTYKITATTSFLFLLCLYNWYKIRKKVSE